MRPLGKKSLNALEHMAEYLEENRYSRRTRESYLAVLEFFFRYYHTKDPDEVNEDEISRFIYDFIIRLGYSVSYQNQVVSAIKTYYNISGRGERSIQECWSGQGVRKFFPRYFRRRK